jgi:hypothetical protein
MALIRVQAIILDKSNIAKENATNTFHFVGSAAVANVSTLITKVQRFYTANIDSLDGNGDNVNGSLINYMAPTVKEIVVKGYDTAGPAPHPPIAETLPSSGTGFLPGAALPSEVAVCLSLRTTPVGGVIAARRRGRVFAGPLNENARFAPALTAARPAAVFTNKLIALAQRLDAEAAAAGYQWVIRSIAGGSYSDVDEVWCDNAFDTQRSRGVRPTVRNAQILAVNVVAP